MNKDPTDTSNDGKEEGPDQETVREWVRSAGKRDEEAFGNLVRTYHKRVYGLAYRFAQNEDDANELVQQTWIKIWNKIGTFKGQSDFFTWVYRVCTYVCLDFLRKRKRQREDPLDERVEPIRRVAAVLPPSANPRPDRQLERAEIREAFDRALKLLTPEHRMALVLREVEGLSYDEIAKAMKCRKGTVMSRLYYARKQVQEHLRGVSVKKKTAERWLSRRMDGELSGRRMRRLERHLRSDTEALGTVREWEEAREMMRAHEVSPSRSADDTWSSVQQALSGDDGRQRGTIPRFSFLWQPGWAVASIALVVVLLGLGAAVLMRGHGNLQMEAMAEADVEWVESDLPNAVTVVYEDAATGWTVIWVDAENGNGHAGS